MPEASIVIRAFNEEKRLPGLFDGLDAQSFKDFETVVVDSGSFDRSREIAARRATRLARVSPRDFTFGHSLNEGIKSGSGKFIVVVSAHTLPADGDWLKHLLAPFEDPKTAMVYGRQRGYQSSKYGELADFERVFGPDPKVLLPPDFFANNANSAVRRELWERHPFDETLPGLEDVEWAKHWMEQGYHVVYEPKAGIFHIHDESWAQVRRRYYREGQAAKWIGVRGRRDLPRETARELAALCGDLAGAAARGRILEKSGEIFRFRWEKLLGTWGGIWDGALMENPLQRERMLFDREYQAVVVRGPHDAALESRGIPSPKPGEVLVRVAFEGVCGTDLEILEGSLGYYRSGLAGYPVVPGHELSGTAAAVGSRVENIREGDRVVVECIQGCGDCEACKRGNPIACPGRCEVGVIRRDGGCAEYMLAPGRFVHRIPDSLPLKRACLAEPLAVVLKGLKRLESAWGKAEKHRAAVLGGGPIGQLAARILSRRGHAVSVFERNAARRDFPSGTGVSVFAELGGLDAFDAFVEATGDPDVLDKALHESKAGAAILLLGFPYGRREFSFETIVGFEKTVVGSVGSGAAEFEEALEILSELDAGAFLRRTLPLSEFQEAWRLAREGKDLKIILQADPSADA